MVGNDAFNFYGRGPSTYRNKSYLSHGLYQLRSIHFNLGAEATLKRFWKTVGIDRRSDGYVITLDKRPLKMPSGATLLVPANKPLVATLIAAEWETQETLLKPHALPMVMECSITRLLLNICHRTDLDSHTRR